MDNQGEPKSWQSVLVEVGQKKANLQKNGYSSELEIVKIIEEFIREQVQSEDSGYPTGSSG